MISLRVVSHNMETEEELQQRIATLRKEIRIIRAERDRLIDSWMTRPLAFQIAFEKTPCFLCEYDGQGYFDPLVHPCAAMYQSLITIHKRHEENKR